MCKSEKRSEALVRGFFFAALLLLLQETYGGLPTGGRLVVMLRYTAVSLHSRDSLFAFCVIPEVVDVPPALPDRVNAVALFVRPVCDQVWSVDVQARQAPPAFLRLHLHLLRLAPSPATRPSVTRVDSPQPGEYGGLPIGCEISR